MDDIIVKGVRGLPLIQKGDKIPVFICEKISLRDGDIVTLASTICSKAKGYTRPLAGIVPSERALRIAKMTGEEPRFLQTVLEASEEVLMEYPFILSEVAGGHVGVRAGVDQSNIDDENVILLPPDPMAEAAAIREEFSAVSGKDVGVIITDTCGRAFRRGQTGNAIGWSGMNAIRDYRGDTDLFGHTLKITEEAVVDELAGIANFVMGESNNGVPAVILRNCGRWEGHDDLYFRKEEDLFRKLMKKE